MPFSYSPAPSDYTTHPTPNNSFTPRSTPASSPCSTPSSATLLSQALTNPSTAPLTPNFLSQLLEGEQDESELRDKVSASLQREQASRGKHDCLNTFSIMCKMADQTLFGLVEWARSSALFKELKVMNCEVRNLFAVVELTKGIYSLLRVGCLLEVRGCGL